MIHHFVLLTLKPGFDRDDSAVVDRLQALSGLKDEIDGIHRWHEGWNFSPSPSASDYALSCQFDSREALQAYLDHPSHRAVANQLRDVMDWVLCDFEGDG